MLIYASATIGVVFSVAGIAAVRPVAKAMGAASDMIDDCVLYGSILIAFETAFILQCEFQSFFVTAEKPKLGLLTTVAAGMTNIGLDALFVAGFHWGIAGAAAATVCSQIIGGIIPVFYFARENTGLLRLTKPSFDIKAFLKFAQTARRS